MLSICAVPTIQVVVPKKLVLSIDNCPWSDRCPIRLRDILLKTPDFPWTSILSLHIHAEQDNTVLDVTTRLSSSQDTDSKTLLLNAYPFHPQLHTDMSLWSVFYLCRTCAVSGCLSSRATSTLFFTYSPLPPIGTRQHVYLSVLHLEFEISFTISSSRLHELRDCLLIRRSRGYESLDVLILELEHGTSSKAWSDSELSEGVEG